MKIYTRGGDTGRLRSSVPVQRRMMCAWKPMEPLMS